MLSRIGVSLVVLAGLVCAVLMAGCGGGSSSVTTPPPPTVTVGMTGTPQTLTAGASAMLTATVANDSANKGVDWTCAPAGACGTFSPAHTASGQATSYTAPASAGSVTITATSTASATAAATATISITAATPQITIAITGAPATLNTNATAQLTATVTNDSTNAGADWSCTPAGSCGNFNPAHTASGAATTYTGPAAAAAVTITAASTAQNTVTTTASITVAVPTPSATLAAGNYAFLLTGTDAGAHSYGLAGGIAVDGNGNVTGGEQDYNNGSGTTSPAGGDKITGGTYTIGTGGLGKLSLVTNNTALGTGGTENFSITVVNSKHVLLTQTDASGSAGGTLDAQTFTANSMTQINGNYSFTVAGTDLGKQEVFGGVIQSAGTGTVHVTVDSNSNGTANTGGSNSGTYTAPDAFGRATMSFGGDTFASYVVGAEVLRLLVTNADEVDTGSAYGQGAGPFSVASLNGSFVFVEGSAVTGATSFVAGGQFTTDHNGNITAGFADSDVAGAPLNGAFTGTYTLNTVGYGGATIASTANTQIVGNAGVYAVDPALNILDPNNTTSGGGGALLLNLGTAVGAGVILPQAAAGTSTFAGNYAVDWRGFTPGGIEQNVDGQVNVAAGLVIAGTADAADLQTGSPHLAVAISGTATADTVNPGRFTLPLAFALPTPVTLHFAVYQASSGDLIWVETDATQYVSGTIQQQQ